MRRLILPLLIAMSAGCSGACAGATQVIKDDATKAVDCVVPAIAALGTCLDAKVASPGLCAFNAAVGLIACVASHPPVPHVAPPAPTRTTASFPAPGPISCRDQCACVEGDTLVCVEPQSVFREIRYDVQSDASYSLPRNMKPVLQYVSQPMRGMPSPRHLE